ncbi:SPRY domain-containing SOCS box protein 1 [Triplophysa tibetana]|uniref:SPRY domain-containing SOCS box protein 1 n=1 Tax=Triplophysa tibetana TaxID=1572043 RepID=A0A5A9NB43_9TELE|nr:SPRY domain-containing SOCS box protein 1 [Triplophysa tibetana]
MGLILCCWLSDRHLKKKTSPSPSSFFSQFSVAPPIRLAVLLDTPPVAHGNPRSQWSQTHISPNLKMCPSGVCVSRDRVEQSSDAVRAAGGVATGLHIWEVLWEARHRGSHALLGVSTRECPLHASGYTALIGGNSCSWGWELTTGQLWHDGKEVGRYPEGGARERLSAPDRILLVVDADAGMLGYVVDNCFLGIAFAGLPSGAELFPAVSCVWGGAKIRLRYLCGMTRDPPPLQTLSALCVCRTLTTHLDSIPPAARRLLFNTITSNT